MPDNASVTPANNAAVIHEISLCVYQAILEIQHQQPELLKEKYRNVPWRDGRNQAVFMLKLQEGLSKAQNQEALIRKTLNFLQILLIPHYFELPIFGNLMEQIRASIHQLAGYSNLASIVRSQLANSSVSPTSGALSELSKGIAILLLDAENLQLDANTEKFLAGVCTYPIQIKIAFANWSKMGKQDLEFHRRGYELIHVPAGKDSADVKMATVGSSIFVHYPTAKEVLVCSSDGVLTHLCTTLQTHGLTVYLVRKQGENITVLNSKTSQTQTHSLKPIPEIPSLEQFITQLKDLITFEQRRIKSQWIKLTRISSLYQDKYNLTISQVVSNHLPDKRDRDIFIDNPEHFAVHQVSDKTGLYISLFELESSEFIENNKLKPSDTKITPQSSAPIKSKSDLENVLVKIIQASTSQKPESYLSITTLGIQFQRQYGQSVTTLIKKLQLNDTFINFLKSCPVFQLQQTDKGWGVTVRKPLEEDAIAQPWHFTE